MRKYVSSLLIGIFIFYSAVNLIIIYYISDPRYPGEFFIQGKHNTGFVSDLKGIGLKGEGGAIKEFLKVNNDEGNNKIMRLWNAAKTRVESTTYLKEGVRNCNIRLMYSNATSVFILLIKLSYVIVMSLWRRRRIFFTLPPPLRNSYCCKISPQFVKSSRFCQVASDSGLPFHLMR